MHDRFSVRPIRVLRRLVLGLVVVAALAMAAGAPAAAEPWRPAAAASVTVAARVAGGIGVGGSVVSAQPGASAIAPDDSDDRDDTSFGWGPSGIIWAGFGWLGLVLVAALLLRRRASRRR